MVERKISKKAALARGAGTLFLLIAAYPFLSAHRPLHFLERATSILLIIMAAALFRSANLEARQVATRDSRECLGKD
jgi:hypothetical protein